MGSRRPFGVVPLLLAVLLLGAWPVAAQEVVVSAADPASGPQGSVGLNVRISGKGFKRGAVAKFLLTGTENPDGIVVHSTTYVSGSELVATIDISAAASVASYDIEIMSGGRTGKGTEIFSVVAPSNSAFGSSCVLPQSDPAFVLVGGLNSVVGGVPRYAGMFGTQIAMRRVTLPSAETGVLVLAVGSASSSRIEMFVLDALTGQEQRRFSVTPDPAVTLGVRSLAAGEINGDGLPDFAVGDVERNTVYVLLSHMVDGVIGYSALRVPRPSHPGAFGWELTLGDLHGDGRDELAVSVDAGGNGKKTVATEVQIYSFDPATSTPIPLWSATLPGPSNGDANASGLAIGDVDGIPGNDLIVGSGLKDSSVTNSGAVYVFTSGTTLAATLHATVPMKDEGFGRKVRTGDVNGDGLDDVVISTGWMGPDRRADVVLNVVTSASIPDLALTMRAERSLTDGWSTSNPAVVDIDGDGRTDIVVGAPNATTDRCMSPGAVHVFRQTLAGPVAHLLWAPTPDPDFAGYGWSVAAVAGSPVLVISEHGRNMAGIKNVGQVYIYRYSPSPQ